MKDQLREFFAQCQDQPFSQRRRSKGSAVAEPGEFNIGFEQPIGNPKKDM